MLPIDVPACTKDPTDSSASRWSTPDAGERMVYLEIRTSHTDIDDSAERTCWSHVFLSDWSDEMYFSFTDSL